MNLTRAFEVALPDIPARMISQHAPRVHPEVVSKEHIVDGHPIVRAYVPGVEAIFSFPPQDWKLIQLFDGARTYEEIAQKYKEETGFEIAVEDVRDTADDLEAIEFWYKTPQEKNILLMQKSADQRRELLKKKKNRWGDMGFVMFPAFNPDGYLTWLHKRTGFIYTPTCTIITLCCFAVMIGIYASYWRELTRDTIQFFNFADKSMFDFAAFWGLTFLLSAVHETAHGLTSKHYGAKVPAMGFALVYLTPAFYTDITEGVVRGTPFQRIMITVSGVWSEMCICSVATVVWWGSAAGTPIHDLAYTLILITGIAVIALNWNPLLKLDGYLIVCDLLNILDLKEHSTAYVAAWVKKHIWRLPVEVPFVPKRRRLGFAIYAIVSGAYSYTILYILARFVGNVFHNVSPEWSFIPEYGTAALIFKPRIRTLVNFMKFVYLDKKDRVRAWLASPRGMAWAVGTVIFALLPLWHDSISGRFVLEPARRAVLRAEVPGTVNLVYASEGQSVAAGAPVVRLRNLAVDSQLARSQADFSVAGSRANAALLHNSGLGSASQERERLRQQTSQLAAESRELEVTSPLAGVVLTPRVADRLGSYVVAGTELAEIGDLSTMRARIYVSEYELYHYEPSAGARLEIDGLLGRRASKPESLSPVSSDVEPGLVDLTKYKGLRPPKFYEVDLLVGNDDGKLRPGMTGVARLYGRRRSLAGLAWEDTSNFFGRKVW